MHTLTDFLHNLPEPLWQGLCYWLGCPTPLLPSLAPNDSVGVLIKKEFGHCIKAIDENQLLMQNTIQNTPFIAINNHYIQQGPWAIRHQYKLENLSGLWFLTHQAHFGLGILKAKVQAIDWYVYEQPSYAQLLNNAAPIALDYSLSFDLTLNQWHTICVLACTKERACPQGIILLQITNPQGLTVHIKPDDIGALKSFVEHKSLMASMQRLVEKSPPDGQISKKSIQL